jgi:hypothetical protein
MNVILLGAGAGVSRGASRGTSGGGDNRYPPWLADADGKTLLERVSAPLLGEPQNRLIYCFLEADIDKYYLSEVISAIDSRQTLLSVVRPTQGAACTALLAADLVDNDSELLIIGLNEYVEVDLVSAAADFRARELDAGTLVFHSVHPRYSFVRLDTDGTVIEAAQGRPISSAATVGAFWFRRGSDFVQGAKHMIRKRDDHGGSYFLCPVFNQLILMQRRIGVTWIENALYHPLKTEAQIHHFEFDPKLG